MTESQTLTLRTKLLVAEYGRSRVIAALAETEDAEFEVLEREVEVLRKKKSTRRRHRLKTLAELLEASKLDAEAYALVKEIGCAYQNKRYLGELWRVKRFLESHGVDAGKLRSRSGSLPMLIGVLGKMSVSELMDIASELKMSERGDLGIIADQILGAKDGQTAVSRAPEHTPPAHDAPTR